MKIEQTLRKADDVSPSVTVEDNHGEFQVYVGPAVVGYGSEPAGAKSNAAEFLREVVKLLTGEVSPSSSSLSVEEQIEQARQRARKRMFKVVARSPFQSGDLGDEFIRFAVEELRPVIDAVSAPLLAEIAHERHEKETVAEAGQALARYHKERVAALESELAEAQGEMDAQQKKPNRQMRAVEDYWAEHYVNKGLCALCGNSGFVDTQATAVSAAGVRCGVRTFCICPNGRTLRRNR